VYSAKHFSKRRNHFLVFTDCMNLCQEIRAALTVWCCVCLPVDCLQGCW